MAISSSSTWFLPVLLLLVGVGPTRTSFCIASMEGTTSNDHWQLQPPPPSPFIGLGPSWIFHNHDFSNNLKSMQKGINRIDGGQRSLQNDSDSCTQDPFLWYIRRSNNNNDSNNDSNEDILGFAVGTMHLDRELVLAEQAWTSLRNALDDSCAVYGELDVTDLSIVEQLSDCVLDMDIGDMVTLDQLPERDQDLREAYKMKLQEYVEEALPESPFQQTLVLEYMMTSVSILQILDVLITFNTQSLSSDMTSTSSTTVPSMLDMDLLQLGRPSGAMETVETQCKVAEALYTLNATDFWDHYEEYWKFELEKGLEASMDSLIDAYRCGDIGTIEEVLNDSNMASIYRKEFFELMFVERNIQMANFIANVLDEQGTAANATKSFFAAGVGHWVHIGNFNDNDNDNSMIQLLADRGYLLERVEGLYDPNLQPDVSDQTCGVWDPSIDGTETEAPTLVGTTDSSETSQGQEETESNELETTPTSYPIDGLNLTLDDTDDNQTAQQESDAEVDTDESLFGSSSACRMLSFVSTISFVLLTTLILLCEFEKA